MRAFSPERGDGRNFWAIEGSGRAVRMLELEAAGKIAHIEHAFSDAGTWSLLDSAGCSVLLLVSKMLLDTILLPVCQSSMPSVLARRHPKPLEFLVEPIRESCVRL